MKPECHIISLGAGVQSSTMALLASEGQIEPMPEAAIFADTQAEPEAVYAWLDTLTTMLPFPVLRVTAGSLDEASTQARTSKHGSRYVSSSIPVFLDEPGRPIAQQRRSCTRDFKIRPITKAAKKIAGRGRRITQWIGITTDEAGRMKPSRDERITNRWPLIEQRGLRIGWSRLDCERWLLGRGLVVPRSACVFCPFHSDSEWSRLTKKDLEAAADYERRLQAAFAGSNRRCKPYLHRSLIQIGQIDFVNPNRQFTWDAECEGYCGV